MRIIFMGTPEFAVPSLEALLRSDDEVVGVVAQPDRPKGRGHALVPPPVKVVAQSAGKPVLQPTKMKDPAFLGAINEWRPDVIAVAAFGRILPPQFCPFRHRVVLMCTARFSPSIGVLRQFSGPSSMAKWKPVLQPC